MPKISFSGLKFSHTFVARRAARWIKGFDGIGGYESIIFCIKNNKNLVDYLSEEVRASYLVSVKKFGKFIDTYPDDEVYAWIPEDYRGVIESIPGGKKWAYRQIKLLRALLAPA